MSFRKYARSVSFLALAIAIGMARTPARRCPTRSRKTGRLWWPLPTCWVSALR